MQSAYENSFFMRRPPHGKATGDHGANQETATSGAGSTTEVDALGDNFISSYIVMRFDADCFIRFGPSGIGAATANDFPIKAGEVWEWLLVGAFDRFFRVIRAGAIDVNIDWYLSDRTSFPPSTPP